MTRSGKHTAGGRWAGVWGLMVFAAAAFSGPAAAVVEAGGLPENAVLVVNADSWASTRIANEYVRLRQIPPGHVIYLTGVTNFENLGVDEFRQQILQPVLQQLDQRGLAGQIDYVLYSADFPTAINVTPDIGDRQLPPVITRLASLTSLTYLHQLVMAKDVRYLDLNCNRYARRLVRPTFDTPWTPAQVSEYGTAAKTLADLTKQRRKPEPGAKEAGDNAEAKQKLAAAIATLRTLRQAHPRAPELLYNLACALAVTGQAEEAMTTLQEAAKAGWWDHRHTARDEDLASLRERAEFKELLTKLQDQQFVLEPTLGFRPAMEILASIPPAAGQRPERYLLSTLLACTSGRGNSVKEALAYLRRSAAADGSRPAGTIYFLQNGDIRSTTREWAFRPAVELLKQIGVQAVIESGVLPQQKKDVAGAMVGSAGFEWSKSGSTILPGAICEHLTSCGGEMQETAGQTPLSEFLRYGAAAASGTVTEPYAIQAKFPNAFLQFHYARGCSAAEAFYQSLNGPYQLLIVGDALCKPWAPSFELTADGWPPTAAPPAAGTPLTTPTPAAVRGLIQLTPKTKTDGAARLFELYVDGRRLGQVLPGQSYELDTTKLPDGWHEVALAGRSRDALDHGGRLTSAILVDNGKETLPVTDAPTGDLPWDKPLTLRVNLPGAKEIVFLHNTRPVARLNAAAGSVTIDLRGLGQGPVRLQPVGMMAGEPSREVWGRPLAFNIIPPPALPAVAPPPEQARKAGFLVTVGGQKPSVVERLDSAALTGAGLAKGRAFTIEADFRVAEDEVYQFQIRGHENVKRLVIDGNAQDWPRGPAWWFVPVPLAPGFHHLRLEGQVVERPDLDVRFGGLGTQRLDAKRQPMWSTAEAPRQEAAPKAT